MIRPVVDFQKAAIDEQIRRWNITDCSMCGYPCGFIIEGEGVLYDSGCHCSSYGPSDYRQSSWEDLAAHYNRNQPENNKGIKQPWLDEVNNFWGFDREVLADA